MDLAWLVRKVDNTIHRIKTYPVDSVVCYVNTYPLDSVDIVIQPSNDQGLFFLGVDFCTSTQICFCNW